MMDKSMFMDPKGTLSVKFGIFVHQTIIFRGYWITIQTIFLSTYY